jgi:hypothetical protein
MIGVIKSRRMRWVQHLAHIAEERKEDPTLLGKPLRYEGSWKN